MLFPPGFGDLKAKRRVEGGCEQHDLVVGRGERREGAQGGCQRPAPKRTEQECTVNMQTLPPLVPWACVFAPVYMCVRWCPFGEAGCVMARHDILTHHTIPQQAYLPRPQEPKRRRGQGLPPPTGLAARGRQRGGGREGGGITSHHYRRMRSFRALWR